MVGEGSVEAGVVFGEEEVEVGSEVVVVVGEEVGGAGEVVV